MYTWFKDCRTAEEGKRLYHQLVKRYHTDNGDDFQRSNRRTGKSMAYIRSTYGSEKVHFDSAPLLN